MPATTLRLGPYEPAQVPLAVELWNRATGDAFPLREALLRQIVALNPHRRSEDAVAGWRGELMVGFALLGCYRGNAAPAAGLMCLAALTTVVVDPEE